MLVEAVRGRFRMGEFLDSVGDAPVAIATVTAAELLFGVERADDAARRASRGAFVEGLLAAVPAVPFGLTEARRLALVWAELARGGALIGPYDMLVAATALALGFDLATLNRREFERVPGLTIVPLEQFQRNAST